MKIIEGILPEFDIRRAFVEGAQWWEYYSTGFTMFQSDRNLAEQEAERLYSEHMEELQARLQLATDLIRVLTHTGMMPENVMVDGGQAWRAWNEEMK